MTVVPTFSQPLPSLQFNELARDLYRMPPATVTGLRNRFEQIGQPLLADARQRAGWSTRIPGAMRVRGFTDTTRGRVGIELRVSTRQAPHARVFEGFGGSGKFRHLVFGRPGSWVPQDTRPYASPAVAAKADNAQRAVVAALDAAVRSCGFR